MIEESKRLIAQMEELIRRAKSLQLEHRGLMDRIRDKRASSQRDLRG